MSFESSLFVLHSLAVATATSYIQILVILYYSCMNNGTSEVKTRSPSSLR